jgi:hypothetical protein
MSSEIDIIGLYREFTNALTEILAENAAVSPARRGRVARAHAAFKRHPSYSEHEFCTAVEKAFMQWESLQNAGLLVPDMFAQSQAFRRRLRRKPLTNRIGHSWARQARKAERLALTMLRTTQT